MMSIEQLTSVRDTLVQELAEATQTGSRSLREEEGLKDVTTAINALIWAKRATSK